MSGCGQLPLLWSVWLLWPIAVVNYPIMVNYHYFCVVSVVVVNYPTVVVSAVDVVNYPTVVVSVVAVINYHYCGQCGCCG